MTLADLEHRLRVVEEQLADALEELAKVQNEQVILRTGIALARWFGPFAVACAAVLISLAKG